MTFFLWFVGSSCYLGLGGITGGVTAYVCRNDESRDNPLPVLCALLWPLAWVGAFVVIVIIGTNRVLVLTGRSIGLRHHRANIARQTVKMMEEDSQRLGPAGQELVLWYNYVACGRCYGSGCRSCNKAGVVRERVAA